MKCFNCGTENMNGSSFCVRCGVNFNNMNSVPIQENVYENNNANTKTYTETLSNSVAFHYLMYLILIIMKPIKGFRENEEKFNDSKIVFVLVLIMSVGMTLLHLFKTILFSVRVPTYKFGQGYTYNWEWGNLKNIKWFEVIGKNFLIFIGIILAIAVVFYLANLIIKKNLTFMKALAISATSIIPAIIGIMILSPIGQLIWTPLNLIFSILGGLFSILILYELINQELKLEGDYKIFFNLACYGILFVAGYFLFMKFFGTTTSPSNLDSILDLIK